MKTYLSDGDAIEFAAPSGGVVSGTGYKIGDTFGVAIASAAEGVKFNLQVRGVVTLPKAASVTPAQGVKLYWVTADGNVTTSASGNTLIGVHAASAVAGASDVTLPVRLGIVA